MSTVSLFVVASTRRSSVRVLVTAMLLLLPTAATAVDDTARPNIVLIMADDMGYSDIGCYGGEIGTPTLDSLAEGGLRFTQFYNTGRCCPTRASLLTGLYPHQAGVGWMMTDRGHHGYRGDLNNQCVTIAEVLKPAGYATYGVGKWHVTKHVQPDGPKFNWPLQRGFDRFYGTITGAGSFFDPGTLVRGNQNISPITDPEYQPDEYYYTDAISDHAVRFVNDHAEQQADKPFFMYVAYTCAHWPMHALQRDIDKYAGKYDGGYGPIRQKRHQRVKELGLVSDEWQLTKQVGNWDEVEHKEWEARCMEVYAAMIDNMDQGIGRIVASLKKNEQLDNTLIFYLQDNGGCQETVGRRGDFKRPVEPSLPEIANDAIRLDVIPKQDRAGVPTLTGPGIMPGPADTYIAYGINWANVSNTPFREYKHFVHEGGIATPLIAHWPKGIQRRGELEHQPGHLIDIMATCVDLARAEYATEHTVKQPDSDEPTAKIKPLEGASLAAAFAGKSLNRESPLFWEHEGNRAIRDGEWKLVAKENRPWELYSMESDRTETNDLAEKKPELVKQLAAKWDAYAKRANVLPLGGWRAKEANYNRKQMRFQLKQGDSLAGDKAPFVKNRGIAIVATLDEIGDGVIVAQGGTAHGYSLYIDDGVPAFAVRRQGELSVVRAEGPLSADRIQLTATLAKDGTATLSADGKQLASVTLPGTLTDMPADGLQVGRDTGGPVAGYQSPNRSDAKITSVLLDLAE